ncbi:SPA protein, chloroplastic [Tanacetum coccineum]|uniref:SPA protein, chloroplastic n=1 Tax=Tanacetum coccineum TaxID=301880 RepID=A0ABQ5A1A4_9ASTR
MCPCPHSALCAETSACDLDERQTGIGRPPGKMEAASYVLRRFSKQESEELDFTFQTGIEAVRILLLQAHANMVDLQDRGEMFPLMVLELMLWSYNASGPELYCHNGVSLKSSTKQQRRYPHLIRAELDQNTVVAVAVGVVSVAFGIGVPIFYESQIDNASKRDNTQPCFPCNGTGAQSCRFCTGSGTVTVELGGGETEVSRCINCDGAGGLTCTTCQSMDSPR